MRLTTKGRYAVTAMLDLAFKQDSGPVSLMEISERQDISLSYLEQLFALLRRRGVVVSARGPGGGYSLAREARHISIADIINAVDEGYDVTACNQSQHPCQNGATCLSHNLWVELSQQIHDFFNGISLGDLMERRGIIEVAKRQDRLLQERKLATRAN